MFRRAQVDFKNRISRYSFVLLGLGLLLVATSCGTGTNPVDIMTEMHYQPSVKYQEPGTLDIPQDVMPYIHRGDPEAVFDINDQTYFIQARSFSAERLYLVNCSMCHGNTGNGDGNVLSILTQKYGYVPVLDPDLTSATVQQMDADALASIITNGVQVMPAFDKLLSKQEIDSLTAYVLALE